ncbi:MAG TPA: PAS domain S-box protein, partial [Gemmatimonadaceae bacterium]
MQAAAVLLGIGLLLFTLARSRPRLRIVATAIAAAVLASAVPSLIIRLTQPALDAGQVEQFVRGVRVQPSVPGTLNPLAPALLTILSVCLLLLTIRRARAVLGVLTVFVAAFGLSIMLSVLYNGGAQGPAGWRLSWTVGSYMTLFSVAMVLLAGSTTWPFSAFAGSSVRAVILRWLTPFTIFVVLGTDVLTLRVFPHFSSGVGSALNALASVIAAVIVATALARVIGDRIARAQDAARASEEKFSRIFQSAPVGISITDVETGRVLEINDHIKRLLEFSREDAVGRTTVDLGMWAIPEERESAWQRMQATGGVEDVEVTLRAKSGTLIPVRYSGQIVEIDGRQQLLSTWVDIRGRKLAEQALKQSEEKFATVFHAAPVGISVSDPADSRILEANDEWLNVLGFTRDEVIGKRAIDLGVWPKPADREAITDRLKRGAAARDSEREIRAKDGTPVTVRGSIQYVELSGAPMMVSAFVNVTDRKRAEEELRHSEAQYRSLVDESRAIIAAVTTDGVTSYLNPAFERVTGWSRADWLGQPFANTLHADDAPRMGEMLAAAARLEPDVIGELRLRTATEKVRIGEFHITPQMRDGKVAGILVVARDVTDRVQLEHQFRQAQKMEAVGRLAGGVAHDFNNLLTVISSYTSLILADGQQPPEVRDDLEEIAKAADSAAALTRQLLAFSRQQVIEPKALDVNDVVRHASKMLKRVIGEDVELRTLLRDDLGNVL